MIENRINISQTFGNRLDVSFYRDRFDFLSKSYPSYPLQQLLEVNPSVSYKHLADSDDISFVPMEVVDEINGVIAEQRTTKVSNNKGFTKFEDNDLLWAKITPCMQNGKSAIVRNLVNGCGCGSTEFFVLRPKTNNILIEYVHYLLRDKKVLESAKNSFGGSAGQQRVSSSYLKSIKIPLPPMEVQQRIVDIYSKASEQKRAKEQEAQALLESIDSYLLGELGITLPKTPQRQLAFKVNISEMLGNRCDPYYHQEYFTEAFDRLNHSPYKKVKLGDISLKITSGITPLSGGDAYTKADDGIAFIRSGNIDINGNLNFEDLLYLLPAVHERKMKSSQVSYGDLMIAIVGATIGQVGIYLNDREANINQAIALVRLYKDTNRQFFKEQIKSSIGQLNLNRLKRPVARANINLEEISTMQLICPPLVKQNEIAETISTIRAKASALQAEASAQLATAKAQIEKIILG